MAVNFFVEDPGKLQKHRQIKDKIYDSAVLRRLFLPSHAKISAN